MQLSEFGKALSAAVQANAYMASASNKLLEGQIWMGLGNYSEAEKVLIEAMKLGSGEVEAELRKVYAIYDRSGKSYDDYLAIKLGKDSDKGQQQKKVEQPEVKSIVPSAPDFSVTTMDGKKLSLKDLNGYIIVINFWNLGCGPCRAEMPDLNKLVEKYKDDEVLFIAFSTDQRIRVDEFLNKKEFNYQIVTEANDVIKAYGVKMLPTHVVINSNGTIHHRLTGGGKNVYEILDNMLGTMLH